MVKLDNINYSNIPATILRLAPSFARSSEYRALVDEGMDDLPGVFLGRFGDYLVRLAKRGPNTKERATAYRLLETILQAQDSRLEEAVVNEIFEVRDDNFEVLRAFFGNLGPLAQSLYKRTCKPLS